LTATSDLIEQGEQSEPMTFRDELLRTKHSMIRYNMRHHLSRYPKDLVRFWWSDEGDLPWPTSWLAYESYTRGEKPGPLYKGPPHRPKLKVIEGGKAALTASAGGAQRPHRPPSPVSKT
jgi:hypothetical protein